MKRRVKGLDEAVEFGEYKIISRCTGHCCRVVYVDISPERLKNVVEKESEENKQISEMLEPLGKTTWYMDPNNNDTYAYRCKNFDSLSQCCKIYNSRPYLCREHPTANTDFECHYDGCTLKLEKRMQMSEGLIKKQ